MKILYLGDEFVHSTSAHRSAALRRLGHEVVHINPRAALPKSRWIGGLSVRAGYWPLAPWVASRMRRKIGARLFDLAWIDAGPELSPGFHRWLRRRGMKIVNYNVDDPFGRRDGRKWALYRQSVRHQDLTVVVRSENIAEARAVGARNVVRVFRSYDPVAHAPLELSDEERRRWAGDVVFVGSWMPERGPFLVRLIELGVPLSIWGDHWQKAPEYATLRPIIRGPAVYGEDYVKAIQCAKVALGLLSKGNRDLHTTRSAEVPFIGGAVLCAERTPEHGRLFEDGVDAMLWTTAEECSERCGLILSDESRRVRMAGHGRNRVIGWRLSNDEVMASVLNAVSTHSLNHALAP